MVRRVPRLAQSRAIMPTPEQQPAEPRREPLTERDEPQRPGQSQPTRPTEQPVNKPDQTPPPKRA